MALTTFAKVKAWANPAVGSGRDTEITRCITAGDAWIKRTANWDIEKVDGIVETLNGDDAMGDVLLMPIRYRPVLRDDSNAVTITEDGTTLTTAASYPDDSSADVYLVGANKQARCELHKGSPWSRGPANVQVTFNAGEAVVPLDIEQLANEVALLFLRTPDWLGKSARSSRGGSVSFEKDLTPQSAELIRHLVEDFV